ncbi:CGNR zinc finger domain-containing protein [Bradyrhizobium aeschynomenes]|uniref:CGNR zinc finger domain-containing protein n=1 Tax=Bradyrhizobium aeschynomenes TaxID=2734909 RepID=UPI0015566DA4|nr:ABATE domain-containing protein [Bradyrhizobium aeschynomenes]NPV19441.1 hypothetical protein [Bradyrhizobium aeschynomenes]
MPKTSTHGAEELAIRFVNTVAWRLRDASEDRLGSPDALLAWLRDNELLSAHDARRVAARWTTQPTAADAAHATALRLREAIYALFLGLIHNRAPPAAPAAFFEEFVGRSSSIRLQWQDGRLNWRADAPRATCDELLRPVALSAAALLTGPRADRIKQCEDDRGCGWLFLDDSRLRNRRWCAMGDCGNVAKARRHRARTAGP